MAALRTFDSSILAFIILFIIFIHSYNRGERLIAQYKIFQALVLLTMALVVIDILGWAFNGLPGPVFSRLNIGSNLLLYMSAPTVPSAWVLYTYYLVNSDEKIIRKVKAALAVLLAANACLAGISLSNGGYFSVDAANLYHRGPLFPIHVGYCEFLLGYSFIFILRHRKHFQRKQFYSITLFFIAPLAGTIIQALNYGVSYNWIGVMISLLIIYFNLQSRNLNTDYLTGVNNRLHFQVYIQEKIRNSSEKRTFGAVMIDIDHFKEINDRFGHGTGDDALKDAVKILKGSLRRDDFIARLGGDEFLVVIDVQTQKELDDAIKRVKEKTETFNAQSSRPYQIEFSLGHAIYNVEAKMNSDDFIDHLDRLMYEDKRRKLRTT